MSDTNLLLYADMVEKLRAFAQGLGQSADQDDARLVIANAFAAINGLREWKHLLSVGQVNTAAPVTGTLSYDHEASGTITDASNATPIVITCSGHGLVDDQIVTITGVGGNTAANGVFRINQLSSSTFELNNSVGNGAYTSGGRWTANRQAKIVSGGDSGSWPSWAEYGYLRVSSVDYKPVRGGNTTFLLLDEYQNPGADVSSGTSFTLYRSAYTLPHDFRAMGQIESASGDMCGGVLLDPQEWLTLQRNASSSATPYSYTIMADPNERGRMALFTYPYPSAAATIQFIYSRAARKLRRSGYASAEYSGTVTVAGSDPTLVTGSSTAFTGDMVGSYLRLGTSTSDLPTADWGQTPYLEQREIIQVIGAGKLRVNAAFNYDYTGVKYRVSDPIDMPAVLHPFLQAACELGLMRMRTREPKEISPFDKAYQTELLLAFEKDNASFARQGVAPSAFGGLHGWHNTPPDDLYS